MADIDLRIRAVDWLAKRLGVLDIQDKDLAAIRKLRRAPGGRFTQRRLERDTPGVWQVDHQAPTRDGAVRVRVYTPPGAAPDGGWPVVVYFHGGGWAIGSVPGYDGVCRRIAEQARTIVASVDYRLAPEHPWPAAVHDSLDALRWVAGHARTLDGDRTRLVVAGDSAGGNLAAVVSILARDDADGTRGPAVAGQLLIYPATDLTGTQPSALAGVNEVILTKDSRDAFKDLYVPPGADVRDPTLSPLFAPDHTGLPPALVITAEHDGLRDEGRAYADALRAAGVPVRYTDYAGMVHGFVGRDRLFRSSAQALSEIVSWLREVQAPPAPRRTLTLL